MRVSAEGGEPEVLTTPDYAAGEIGHLAPQLLPDQKHVLFTARRGGSGQAAILSLATGQWQRLEELGSLSEVRYLPTGHLAYVASDSALTVVPFDLDRFEPTGPATTAYDDRFGPDIFGQLAGAPVSRVAPGSRRVHT